jgi:hypothetical protein
VTIDTETPYVVPGAIRQIITISDSGVTRVYPPETEANAFPGVLEVIPTYNTDQRLTEWTLLFYDVSPPGSAARTRQGDIIGVTVYFEFTASFAKWASATVPSLGVYTHTFPMSTNSISAAGDLKFDQNEINDFRGGFSNLNIEPGLEPEEILTQQESAGAVFFVDWEPTIAQFGPWRNFTIALRIRVKEVEIVHSIPLVASIETVIILYIAMFMLARIVVNAVQGYAFRSGLVKSWPIQQFTAPVHEKIH